MDTGASAGRGWTFRAAPPLPLSVDLATLRGRYRVVLVATAGLSIKDRDSVRIGELVLAANDTAHLHILCSTGTICGNPAVSFPLIGYTDSAFAFPGVASPHAPFTSRTVDNPGVIAEFDSHEHSLTLKFGSPYVGIYEGGAYSNVFAATATGLAGRWADAGWHRAEDQPGQPTRTQGYFCATRIDD